MSQAAEALAEFVVSAADSPPEAVERDDVFDLSCVLAELRNLVEFDWEFVDLQRKAVRAACSGLPGGYVALVVLDFCDYWLEFAESTNPARPLVEKLARQLRPLADDEPAENPRQVVHGAAEFVRRARPYRYEIPRLRVVPDDRPRRRQGRRESRPSRRRLHVRSGSRGDPPDEPDDPADVGLEPGPAGPVGVGAAP
jgi:hypothetical protein